MIENAYPRANQDLWDKFCAGNPNTAEAEFFAQVTNDCLKAQVSLVQGAQQRGLAMAAFFGTMAAALMAAAVALFTVGPPTVHLSIGALTSAALLIAASIYAVIYASPRTHRIPGNTLGFFVNDLDAPYRDLLMAAAYANSRNIEQNDEEWNRRAPYFMNASALALAALFFGPVSALLAWAFL